MLWNKPWQILVPPHKTITCFIKLTTFLGGLFHNMEFGFHMAFSAFI